MSNIGIAANLFQPSGKCLKCRHWNPATKDFMGNGTDGHCRLAYCKNSRPERRNISKIYFAKNTHCIMKEKGADCGCREGPTPIYKIVLRFSNELGMIKALFANL